MQLTVLGCSGSFSSGKYGPASSYLVQYGDTNVWVDAGHGSFTELEKRLPLEHLSAVVLSHEHPDHCGDVFNLVGAYYLDEQAPKRPVYGNAHLLNKLAQFDHSLEKTCDFNEIKDGSEVAIGAFTFHFSETSHSVPTLASHIEADGKHVIYTADTGPEWSAKVFEIEPNILVAEASYQDNYRHDFPHLTAREAGQMARDIEADMLLLTHVWPRLDREVSRKEAAAEFHGNIEVATVGMRLEV